MARKTTRATPRARLRPGASVDPAPRPVAGIDTHTPDESQIVVHAPLSRMREHVESGFWGGGAGRAHPDDVIRAASGLISGPPALPNPAGRMRTPVRTFDQYPRSDQQRIRAHAETLGLTPGVIRGNVRDLTAKGLERGESTGEHLPGKDWYPVESERIGRRAREQGVDPNKLTAQTAATSPTVPWKTGGRLTNLDIATHISHLVQHDPSITITPAHASHLEQVQQDQASDPKRQLGRNPINWHGLVGTHKLSALPSHVVATLGSFSGNAGREKAAPDPTTGEMVRKPTPTFASHGLPSFPDLRPLAQARSRMNVTKALDIARGHSTADQALSGYGTPKPRTFNDNLAEPFSAPKRMTVDRWALRGVSGGSIEDLPPVPKGRRSDPIPQASEEAHHQGLYAFVQHHASQAAAERGLHAHELQAANWVQIKGEHEGFKQFHDLDPDEEPMGGERAAAEGRIRAGQRRARRSGAMSGAQFEPHEGWG